VATPTAPALSPEEEDPLPTGVYSYAKRQQLGNLIPGLPTEKLNDLLAVIQQYSNAVRALFKPALILQIVFFFFF
jgi:hypothetical protein